MRYCQLLSYRGASIGVLRAEVEKGWRSRELVEEFVALITDSRFPA